jgi:sulfur-oxidizing protein SoxZ
MAKNRLKVKARKGVINIKTIIAHPMESGLRKVKGKIVPANHLTNVSITQNGTTVVNADVNGSISKDPFFNFKVAGKKGDEIVVSYADNLGKKGTIKKKSK